MSGGGSGAANAASPLTIPTYDGSGQCTHPDVYYNASGWNGKNYWMAFTPYAGGSNALENPSIICSDDGQTWTVPVGLTNPVVPALTGDDHNADPDIVVDGDGTMWLYWMSRSPGEWQKVSVKSSADGVTWSEAQELLSDVDLSFGSPCVIYDGTQYVMWYVDVTATPGVMKRRTCATPNGTWSAASNCTINSLPSFLEPWHINVIKFGSEYRLYLNARNSGSNSGYVIYAATSSDGLTWTVQTDATAMPLINVTPSGHGYWDDTFIYRTAAVKTASGADLWYSAKNLAGEWRIGFTQEEFE